MHEVSSRAPIALPIAACWAKLRDFSRAIDYVPGLTDLRVTTPQTSGLGASRIVVSAQAGAMDETITEWNEGTGFRLRLHRGDQGPMPPMREATFEYALEPSASAPGQSTDIVLRMPYKLSFGVLGRLLNALVLQRVMQRNIDNVALALAENYITDARVDSARLKELRAARR